VLYVIMIHILIHCEESMIDYKLKCNYAMNNYRSVIVRQGNFLINLLDYNDKCDIDCYGYDLEYAERSIIKCPYCKTGDIIYWYHDIRECDIHCELCNTNNEYYPDELI